MSSPIAARRPPASAARADPARRSAGGKRWSGTRHIPARPRTLRAREEFNRGSDGQPLSEADVVRKFTDNAARVLSPSRVQQVLELMMALDRAADVVALTDALAR